MEDGVQVAYGGNWDKSELYSSFVNYGHPPLFAIREARPHAERKKIYSHVYSKSTIDNSDQLKDVLQKMSEKLRLRLKSWSERGSIINVFPVAESFNMDVATAYIYGGNNATNWIENDVEASRYLPAFQAILGPWPMFVFTELPGLMEKLGKIKVNLVSNQILTAMETVLPFFHDLTSRAMKDLQPETLEDKEKREYCHPPSTALQHIQTKLSESKIPEKDRFDLLASDLLDQAHAAHEATGIVITYLMWELSRKPIVQNELREELKNLATSGQSPLSSKTLDNVMLETIRRYPGAFGPFPRCAPSRGGKIGGYDLPPGTVVNASPYWIGRNHEIFENADTWQPDRWTNLSVGEKKQKRKWVWMFLSGSRMCIGEHLGMLAMKTFIVEVYTNFRTTIARESNMKQLETFIAIPADAALYLQFHRA